MLLPSKFRLQRHNRFLEHHPCGSGDVGFLGSTGRRAAGRGPSNAKAARVTRNKVSHMEIKALVADSSAKARKNIIRSLKQIGVQNVAEANNGNEAIQLLETGTYDVVFAEWNTRIEGGENVVKAFRKRNSKLPVIVTAPPSKTPADLQKTFPEASNYLTLPLTTEQLRKTVSEYVPSIAS